MRQGDSIAIRPGAVESFIWSKEPESAPFIRELVLSLRCDAAGLRQHYPGERVDRRPVETRNSQYIIATTTAITVDASAQVPCQRSGMHGPTLRGRQRDGSGDQSDTSGRDMNRDQQWRHVHALTA